MGSQRRRPVRISPSGRVVDLTRLYGGYGLEPVNADAVPTASSPRSGMADWASRGRIAYAFGEVQCPASGWLTLSVVSDGPTDWYIDGRPIGSALASEPAPDPGRVAEQVFSVETTPGRHVLAARAQAGQARWFFTCGPLSTAGSGAAPPGPESQGSWGYLSVCDDLILGSHVGGGTARTVFALSKEAGSVRWAYRARERIANTSIVFGDGRLFLLDGPTRGQVEMVRRRGQELEARNTLVALDLARGRVLWRSQELPPDQYRLYYSRGVVLVGASAAFDTAMGRRLWEYGDPEERPRAAPGAWVMQSAAVCDPRTGALPTRTHPLTGRQEPWTLPRSHGCGPVVGCEGLLLFRSGQYGLFDFAEGGTTNFGAVRSGCAVNMIPACGVLLVPEASSGCDCRTNFQTTVALVPAPHAAQPWFVFGGGNETSPLKELHLNFGAPGDRRDAQGTTWLGFPRPPVPGACPVPLTLQMESPRWLGPPFRPQAPGAHEEDFVHAWGLEGYGKMTLTVNAPGADARPYRVRLHFAVQEDAATGKGAFDVWLQGERVLHGLDVAGEAGAPGRPLVQELDPVSARDTLTIELIPSADSAQGAPPPLLTALEVMAE